MIHRSGTSGTRQEATRRLWPGNRTVSEWGHGSDDKERCRGRIKDNESMNSALAMIPSERNKRSVWTVATHSFKGTHFATFPPNLIRPCVLAGASGGGIVLDPFGGGRHAGRPTVSLLRTKPALCRHGLTLNCSDLARRRGTEGRFSRLCTSRLTHPHLLR